MFEPEVQSILPIRVFSDFYAFGGRTEGGGLICKASFVLAIEPCRKCVGFNAQVRGNLAFLLAMGNCLNGCIFLLDGSDIQLTFDWNRSWSGCRPYGCWLVLTEWLLKASLTLHILILKHSHTDFNWLNCYHIPSPSNRITLKYFLFISLLQSKTC